MLDIGSLSMEGLKSKDHILFGGREALNSLYFQD
jgi:hypothetical protein